jgi:hypothetical protein
MADLNRTLLELFRSADGLLLPDETVIEEISKKHDELRLWNEDIVLQGLITMKDLLQELADQNRIDFVHLWDDTDWSIQDSPRNLSPERNQHSPSIWELARHLSNWTIVFVPPVRALDLNGDLELIRCLDSPDHYVSTLAAVMLGCGEFNFVGSIEKFSEMMNHSCASSLRLEVCRILYSRYHDLQAFRKEIVPNLVTSDSQFDVIVESDIRRNKFLDHLRELVVWDIATQGEGPRRKWAQWWV